MIWNNNVSYWRQFTQWNQNILEKSVLKLATSWLKNPDFTLFQIPYVLADNLGQNDRLTIAKAMEQIEHDTCVKFVPRGLSPYYVHIGR